MKTVALLSLVGSVAAFDLNTKFEDFKQTYNRNYSSEAEELKRFKIFAKNVELVELMKTMDPSAEYSWKTPFADIENERFTDRNTLSVTPATLKAHKENAVDVKVNAAALPTSFDWISKGAVTGVKNQEQCGSCWAFATVASIEGSNFLTNKSLISLAEQELVDCDKNDNGCGGGLPSNAYKDLIDNKMGLELESDYTYTARDGSCQAKASLEKVFIASWKQISSDEDTIAQALMQSGPLAIGINAQWMQMYSGGVSDPLICNPQALDHGVTIVSFGEDSGKKWWRIKNSWGSGWGEKGYYRIVRGKGKCGVNRMVTSVQASKSLAALPAPTDALFV